MDIIERKASKLDENDFTSAKTAFTRALERSPNPGYDENIRCYFSYIGGYSYIIKKE